MSAVLTMVGALLFPLLALGLVFVMCHLEETLPRDVARARRRAEPPPILAIPVHGPAPESVTTAVLEVPSPQAAVSELPVAPREVPVLHRGLVERPAS